MESSPDSLHCLIDTEQTKIRLNVRVKCFLSGNNGEVLMTSLLSDDAKRSDLASQNTSLAT